LFSIIDNSIKSKNKLIMKSAVSFISILAIFTVVSCSPAKNDSQERSQTPVVPQPQEQNSSNIAEPQTPPEVTEENNAQVTINPPHGQPGHRCDIPVGAPLNSAPQNTTPQITTTQPSTSVPNIANNPTAPTLENAQRINSSQPRSTTTTQNSGRINPPHGQPGHRCDIPVGSPLP
jgi:hypothetical protein